MLDDKFLNFMFVFVGTALCSQKVVFRSHWNKRSCLSWKYTD